MLNAISPENSGATLVLLGAFAPPNFSPDWMLSNKLIGEGDRAAANSHQLIVSHQVTVWETEWFGIQASPERLLLRGVGPVTPALRDLAMGVLTLLPETPVEALGMNFSTHFKIGGREIYHKIGDVLAPKDIWKTLVPEGHSVGMSDLTVLIQPFQRDGVVSTKDSVQISVQPSNSVAGGIFININNHKNIAERDATKSKPAEIAFEIIEKEWESLWQSSGETMVKLLEGAIA